jgi:hypothetical protein
MTGRNATLLPRRWVVRANQADARAEKAEEPASEDDGPGRTFDDKQANDDEHGREDEPGPCSGLEDGHDDLPSISYTGVGSLRRPYTGRRAASSVLHQGTRRWRYVKQPTAKCESGATSRPSGRAVEWPTGTPLALPFCLDRGSARRLAVHGAVALAAHLLLSGALRTRGAPLGARQAPVTRRVADEASSGRDACAASCSTGSRRLRQQ